MRGEDKFKVFKFYLKMNIFTECLNMDGNDSVERGKLITLIAEEMFLVKQEG